MNADTIECLRSELRAIIDSRILLGAIPLRYQERFKRAPPDYLSVDNKEQVHRLKKILSIFSTDFEVNGLWVTPKSSEYANVCLSPITIASFNDVLGSSSRVNSSAGHTNSELPPGMFSTHTMSTTRQASPGLQASQDPMNSTTRMRDSSSSPVDINISLDALSLGRTTREQKSGRGGGGASLSDQPQQQQHGARAIDILHAEVSPPSSSQPGSLRDEWGISRRYPLNGDPNANSQQHQQHQQHQQEQEHQQEHQQYQQQYNRNHRPKSEELPPPVSSTDTHGEYYHAHSAQVRQHSPPVPNHEQYHQNQQRLQHQEYQQHNQQQDVQYDPQYYHQEAPRYDLASSEGRHNFSPSYPPLHPAQHPTQHPAQHYPQHNPQSHKHPYQHKLSPREDTYHPQGHHYQPNASLPAPAILPHSPAPSNHLSADSSYYHPSRYVPHQHQHPQQHTQQHPHPPQSHPRGTPGAPGGATGSNPAAAEPFHADFLNKVGELYIRPISAEHFFHVYYAGNPAAAAAAAASGGVAKRLAGRSYIDLSTGATLQSAGTSTSCSTAAATITGSSSSTSTSSRGDLMTTTPTTTAAAAPAHIPAVAGSSVSSMAPKGPLHMSGECNGLGPCTAAFVTAAMSSREVLLEELKEIVSARMPLVEVPSQYEKKFRKQLRLVLSAEGFSKLKKVFVFFSKHFRIIGEDLIEPTVSTFATDGVAARARGAASAGVGGSGGSRGGGGGGGGGMFRGDSSLAGTFSGQSFGDISGEGDDRPLVLRAGFSEPAPINLSKKEIREQLLEVLEEEGVPMPIPHVYTLYKKKFGIPLKLSLASIGFTRPKDFFSKYPSEFKVVGDNDVQAVREPGKRTPSNNAAGVSASMSGTYAVRGDESLNNSFGSLTQDHPSMEQLMKYFN